MGSIAHIESPGNYYYRSNTAALNAAMQGLAAALESREIDVLILHPGGVKTKAYITPLSIQRDILTTISLLPPGYDKFRHQRGSITLLFSPDSSINTDAAGE